MARFLLCLIALLVATQAAPTPGLTQADNETFLEGFKGPFPTLDGWAGTEISSTVSLLYQNVSSCMRPQQASSTLVSTI